VCVCARRFKGRDGYRKVKVLTTWCLWSATSQRDSHVEADGQTNEDAGPQQSPDSVLSYRVALVEVVTVTVTIDQ
jgi:hypothetical protein